MYTKGEAIHKTIHKHGIPKIESKTYKTRKQTTHEYLKENKDETC
jgi:hypothetical protein